MGNRIRNHLLNNRIRNNDQEDRSEEDGKEVQQGPYQAEGDGDEDQGAPGPGRPRVVIKWDDFDKLCALQCTLEEIASWFGCSVATIERAVQREKDINFAEYFEQKRRKGKIALRRAQFQAAESGNATMLIWLGKQLLGQKDTQAVELTGRDGGPIRVAGVTQNWQDMPHGELLVKAAEALEVLRVEVIKPQAIEAPVERTPTADTTKD